MANWRNTNYTELVPDSPQEALSGGSTRVLRELLLADGSLQGRQQAAWDFLGYPELAVVASGDHSKNLRYISRVTPHPLPWQTPPARFPGGKVPEKFLYANSINAQKPLGVVAKDVNDLGAAAVAQLNIGYSTLTYNVKEDDAVVGGTADAGSPPRWPVSPLYDPTAVIPAGFVDEGWVLGYSGRLSNDFAGGWQNSRYISKFLVPSGRMRTLRPGLLKLVDGNATPLFEGFTVSENRAAVRYIWHQVPVDAVPWIGIASCLNRCNQYAFDGFSAQSLILETVDMQLDRNAVGVRCVDIIYNLTHIPNYSYDNPSVPRGVNWVLRASGTPPTLNYVMVSSDGTVTGSLPFVPKDFANLFRPDQP